MPGPRRWNGARPTPSTTSSACPVRSRYRRESTRRRMRCALSALCRTSPSCAAMPNVPQGQILEPRAARRRPHRSRSARARHPLRRHQRRMRRGRMGLQRLLLRARTGREPHQIAQDTARFRSNVLSFRDRKSGPPRAAHGGLYQEFDDRNRSSPHCRSANARPRRCAKSSAIRARSNRIGITGSCSPFATPSPNRAISRTPSSRPCGCG